MVPFHELLCEKKQACADLANYTLFYLIFLGWGVEEKGREYEGSSVVLCGWERGTGVPVEPASRCCKGENKHSPSGLFTQGVNSNFDFILLYQGPILPSLILPLSCFLFLS